MIRDCSTCRYLYVEAVRPGLQSHLCFHAQAPTQGEETRLAIAPEGHCRPVRTHYVEAIQPAASTHIARRKA